MRCICCGKETDIVLCASCAVLHGNAPILFLSRESAEICRRSMQDNKKSSLHLTDEPAVEQKNDSGTLENQEKTDTQNSSDLQRTKTETNTVEPKPEETEPDQEKLRAMSDRDALIAPLSRSERSRMGASDWQLKGADRLLKVVIVFFILFAAVSLYMNFTDEEAAELGVGIGYAFCCVFLSVLCAFGCRRQKRLLNIKNRLRELNAKIWDHTCPVCAGEKTAWSFVEHGKSFRPKKVLCSCCNGVGKLPERGDQIYKYKETVQYKHLHGGCPYCHGVRWVIRGKTKQDQPIAIWEVPAEISDIAGSPKKKQLAFAIMIPCPKCRGKTIG